MYPMPGDVVYAYVKTKPPSRRWLSMRFGLQRPVLRVTARVSTDVDGNDWICVLPVPYGVLRARLNPDDVKWIPAADATAYKETVAEEIMEVVHRVLHGHDPRYPWIRLETDEAHSEPRPDEDYPTVEEALRSL